MSGDWVDDMVVAYRLTNEIVLDFLKERFPEGKDGDFTVHVSANFGQFQYFP